MSWKPIDHNIIVCIRQIVLVWDKIKDTLYVGDVEQISTIHDGNSDCGTGVFLSGITAHVKGGDCWVKPHQSSEDYSYDIEGRTKPDILYVSADSNLIWPKNHWPVMAIDTARSPLCSINSKAWIVGVWSPGTNFGDAYKENVMT